MYAQQQTPYIQPVMPVPSQPDSIEQASRVIDLFEKLSQRNASNPQPGLSQFGQLNAGQFQSRSPQELAMQEFLLRNPQLLQQFQQQGQVQQPQQQQETGSRTFSAQEIGQLKGSFDTAVNCYNQQVQMTQGVWNLALNVLNALNAQAAYVQELEKFAQMGMHSHAMANAFYAEIEALRDIANIQAAMLGTPQYLLHHAFGTFDRHMSANDVTAMEAISLQYMDLVKSFEEKRRSAYGGYSPQYQAYLQNEINQSQQPQQAVIPQEAQVVAGIAQFAQGLNTPGFGQSIKRQHTQRLLNR